MAEHNQGFILTRHWRDASDGVELQFWLATDRGAVQIIVENQQAVFFLPLAERQLAGRLLKLIPQWQCKPTELKDFSGCQVDAYYFNHQRDLRSARDILIQQKLDPLEADIKPSDRFLMERFIRGSLAFESESLSPVCESPVRNCRLIATDYPPRLKTLSIDIETAMQGLTLFSIAVYAVENGCEIKHVFMVSSDYVDTDVFFYQTEQTLLVGFLEWLERYDPDVIIGWNVIDFDLWFLARLCEKYQLAFGLGRNREVPHWRLLDDEGRRRACAVPGRVVLDGIEMVKAAGYRFERYGLAFVAEEVLDKTKLISGESRGEKISELFEANKIALARYNIHDCRLVWEIVEKLKLIDFSVARSRLTGLPLDRIGGSVASFDFRYLPLMHRQGYVAPNAHLKDSFEQSPGGFVMESLPGLYRHVLVLDFKSLYPSIIRSFNIDPVAMIAAEHKDYQQEQLVPGFNGAWFAKDQSILPALIAELWQSRDQAKANNDQPLSQAIKILMNSFYGVLGSGGCRFFDSRLASSITRRGHQIIQQTATYIESLSFQFIDDNSVQCKVIYGDTDSVFVWLKGNKTDQIADEIGAEMAEKLNTWWQGRLKKEYQINSVLEIEYETHFKRFVMPTIRGSETGSKKRYAGLVKTTMGDKLVFKGLENVRTDWTQLARDVQREVYRRVFYDEPYKSYIIDIVEKTRAGFFDQQLVYKKRLRRKLADYQRNVPPHVQAAKKAQRLGDTINQGDWSEYVISLNGPEPLLAKTAALDYQHYLDRQLAPAVDSILYFMNDSFDNIIDQQLSFFDV